MTQPYHVIENPFAQNGARAVTGPKGFEFYPPIHDTSVVADLLNEQHAEIERLRAKCELPQTTGPTPEEIARWKALPYPDGGHE